MVGEIAIGLEIYCFCHILIVAKVIKIVTFEPRALIEMGKRLRFLLHFLFPPV